MFKHLLPNAMVATLTFLPFILNGSITTLTSLDFLGFGLPPGSPSLGELLAQGKANLQAPWLGLTGFVVIALMLSLLIFIGEAVRDAFDPRKAFAMSEPLLSVQDLSVAFRQGGRDTLAVDRISFDIMHGRDAGARRRIRLRQVGLGAVDPEASALPVGAPSVRQDPVQGHRTSSPPTRTRCARCAATTSPWCSRSR